MVLGLKQQRNLARAAYTSGKTDVAIAKQQALIAQQAQHSGEVLVSDYRQLAFFLIAAQRAHDAVSLLTPVVAARPLNADLNSILGLCHTNLRAFDSAIPYLNRALEIDQNCFLAADQLTRCYLGKGDIKNTKSAGEQSLAIKDRLFSPKPLAMLRDPPVAFDPARKRGHVISFSLWGDNPRYIKGALRNCELAAELYPGWQCRFYVDNSVPQMLIQNLGARGADIRQMPKRKHLFDGLFWRFLVMSDEKVARYLIRDCDAVINVKERVAVEQWLQSDKHFHVMRDYYTHTDLVMAGMWGGVGGVVEEIESLIEDFQQNHIQSRVMDQTFLNEVLWSTIRQSSLIHDSCFNSYNSQTFPPYCGLPPGRHIGQDESAVRIRQA